MLKDTDIEFQESKRSKFDTIEDYEQDYLELDVVSDDIGSNVYEEDDEMNHCDNEERGDVHMCNNDVFTDVEAITFCYDDVESTDEDGPLGLLHLTNCCDDFSPFSSKAEAFVYILLNSPRPMGENNLKFILFVLNQMNCVLPSLDSVKKIALPGFDAPRKFYSPSGTPFYMNLPSSIIRRCFANPSTSSLIRRYPVISERKTEIFEAQRWHSMFPAFMTKISNNSHIFVRDFVVYHDSLLSKTIAKVLRFYEKLTETGIFLEIERILSFEQFWRLHPEISMLNCDQTYIIADHSEIHVDYVEHLISCPHDLLKRNGSTIEPLEFEEYLVYTAEHPMKIAAAGVPVVVSPLILYSDDFSGNRSKKWNKFDAWCVTLASLPMKEARKFENIHFIACSNVVSAVDMTEPLVEDLLTLENGLKMFDACTQREVLVVAPVICCLCDNVRASELLNHLGSKAVKFCWFCMTSSSQSYTTGALRTTQLTRSHIEIIKNQKTESAKRLKRTEYGIKEKDNSLFKLKSVDFFRSMPVECLHTVLLGACKYMLRSFMNPASNSTKKEILAIISSFPQCGFSTRLTGNICYYYKSFVGRDFKTWLQMCVFVLQKYLSPDETKCWFLLAKVFKIAYKYPTLSNTEVVSDKKTCQDFVDCANMYMPEFARRLKVHLILHLVECIQEFGPASGFNTESIQLIDTCSNIFGNRHAPSKDIAHNFAALEHLRFICCGGFYKQDGIYRSCGQGLIDLYKNPCVQQFINQLPSHQFTETKAIYQPGCLRKLSPTTVPCKLSEIHVAFCYDKFKHKFCDYITDSTLNLDLSPSLSMESLVLDHGAVFTSSRVLAHKGDFVKINLEISYGILLACCAVTDLGFDFCLVQELELQTDPNGDPILTEFECPLFLLTTNIHAVSTKTIICPVSVVHVCDALCCFVHENVTTSVERHIVSSNKFVYRHNLSNGLYCLNIFCISTDF